MTNAIIIHLAKDMVPFRTVEKDGFRDMIKTLDPRYVILTRKYDNPQSVPKAQS